MLYYTAVPGSQKGYQTQQPELLGQGVCPECSIRRVVCTTRAQHGDAVRADDGDARLLLRFHPSCFMAAAHIKYIKYVGRGACMAWTISHEWFELKN